MKHKTPQLIPLDMSLIDSVKCLHPEINEKDIYLCLIDNKYFIGNFVKTYHGLEFDGWYQTSFFPFKMSFLLGVSKWQQIWKVIDGKQI